jgi:hypothetical protein
MHAAFIYLFIYLRDLPANFIWWAEVKFDFTHVACETYKATIKLLGLYYQTSVLLLEIEGILRFQ